MEEYVWISKLADHPVFCNRDHPVLRRLADEYDVRMTIDGPRDMSIEPYVQAVYEAVERRAAGIMIVGWGNAEIIPAIEAAVDKAIPVVTIDSDIPGCRRLAHIGTDWFRMGGAMADELATRIGGRGRVLIIGMSELANVQAGFGGFQFRMGAYSNIEVLPPEDDMEIGPERAQAVVAEYLRQYPDLAGIAGFGRHSGPGAAAAVEAADKSKSVKIVSVETDSPHLAYLRSGVIDSLFAQKREIFTNLAFQMLYTYNHGSAATGYRPGAVNIPGNVDTGFVVVTNKNVDSYEAEYGLEDAFRRHELSQRLALVSGIVESSAEIALAADLEGRIVYANQAAFNLLPLEVNRLHEASIETIFDLTDEQKALIERCSSEGVSVRFEASSAGGGDARPYQVSVSPLRGARLVRGMVVIASDISSLKQVSHKLRESEERYGHLFNNLSDAVFVHDERGKILDVNIKAVKLFDYSREEILALTIDRLHPPEELPASAQAFERIAKDGFVQFETKFVTKGGGVFMAEVTSNLFTIGETRVIQGIVRDITEKKNAEDRLHLLSSIAEQSSEGIALADLDGHLEFVNRAFATMHGYLPEELRGKHISVFHTEGQMPSVEAANRQIEETGEFYGEIWHARRDGTVFPSIMRNTLLLDRQGKPTGIIALMRDITERRRADEALLESEERYRTFVENFQGIAYKGKINVAPVFFRGAVENITGYTESQLLAGKPGWFEIIHPEDRPRIEESAQRIREIPHYSAEREYRIIHRDGGVRWVHESVQNTCDEPGRPSMVQGAIYDITDRKLAEEALRENEERFRVFFRTSPDVITISDLESGRLIDVNESFEAVSGYSREEAVGRTSLELKLWSDLNFRKRVIAELQQGGRISNMEIGFRVKDGSLRTCLLSGNIIRLQGKSYLFTAVRDIEELTRAQNALQESEERFRTIFETARDAIFIKDCELKFLAVNPSLAELFGMKPEQFVGRTFEELFSDIDADRYNRSETKVLNGEIIATENLFDLHGESRTLHVIIVPLRDARGKIIGLCGIARDITETKKLQEFADRARRLEAAGRIAGQVAHDFNNLLGPLVAYPGLMRDELPENHPVMEYLVDMEKAAQQMADINQQLLTLGRRGHYNLEPVNVNKVINQALDRRQPFPPRLTVKTEMDPDLMNISGGVSQIYRAFANLIANAMDAMTDGGELYIRTENYYVNEAHGKYNRIPRGEFVKVTVADTGVGIADDIMPQIFDPFFTTKTVDRKRGSGLGLSIVHAVVEDHKGYIDTESHPGRGSRFYLYFPISREQADEVAPDLVLGGDERILIVDDDPMQKEVTSRLLRKLGYTTEAVDSGEAALEYLSCRRPDLVIMDMIMSPGMDGAETYRRAIKINPDLKAIIISGYADSDRVKVAMKLGVGTFLKKPMTLQTAAAAVRRELDRKSKKTP